MESIKYHSSLEYAKEYLFSLLSDIPDVLFDPLVGFSDVLFGRPLLPVVVEAVAALVQQVPVTPDATNEQFRNSNQPQMLILKLNHKH